MKEILDIYKRDSMSHNPNPTKKEKKPGTNKATFTASLAP